MQFSSRRPASAFLAIIVSLALPLTVSSAVFAQDDANAAAPAVAGTGVARIDALSGDVAIQRGDSNDTLAAVPNAPVLGADYVTTGQNGRAEVGFDGRSAVRLGENVQIRFSKLDPGDRQMQLAAGSVDLRLFGDTDGQSAIDTPSISVVPRSSGSFRVAVDANGETSVTVRSGRADIVTPQGTQSLEPGTTLIADGAAANPQIQTQPAIALDNFDSYNNERDHIYQLAVAQSQYVNPDIQGVGDLSASGRWVADGTYGNVWVPVGVAPGWAPYRNGNWTWEDGYGWTWVANESWGWAPYHYGRWYFSSAYHQWAWYPPARVAVVPAWSPALVGFIGFNIGAVSVGIGFGNIGWVPLAPFEAFHPWWGPGARTTVVNNTTIVNNYNNTNVYNNNSVHYRNLTVNNAMTSVTRENFQSGRFENPTVISQEQLRTIHPVPVRGALPIVPSQANLRFTQRVVAPSLAARPAFATTRTFAGHYTPPVRTPFTEQQASVSRVTHVAFRSEVPAGTPALTHGAPAAVPAYARPATVGAPALTRPVTGGAPALTRPATAGAPGVAPSYTHGTGSGDPWSRFNSNRSVPNTGSPAAGTPGYARPATTTVRTGIAPPAASVHPANPGYVTPQYEHQTTPAYAHPVTPAGTYAPHVTAPAYTHVAAPGYVRPPTSGYSHTVAPTYVRPAGTTFSHPAGASHPASDHTPHGEEHHG